MKRRCAWKFHRGNEQISLCMQIVIISTSVDYRGATQISRETKKTSPPHLIHIYIIVCNAEEASRVTRKTLIDERCRNGNKGERERERDRGRERKHNNQEHLVGITN